MTSIPTSTAITALLLAALGCASGGVMALNQEMLKALAVPEVKERLASLGGGYRCQQPRTDGGVLQVGTGEIYQGGAGGKIRAE